MKRDSHITFNSELFALAIDAVRGAKGLTWAQTADEAGVSKATVSRVQRGYNPDADSLARLLHWSKMDFRRFIAGGDQAEGKDAV